MDVHFVHDHSCSTFVKFCLFGAFTIITVILQVTVTSKAMFRISLMPLFFVFIVCSFCGKDFKSLGRHVWRCNEKAKSKDKERNNASSTSDSGYKTSLQAVDTDSPNSTCISVKCSCGNICNGQ